MYVDEIREAAEGLTAEGLREAIGALQAMVVRALAGPEEEPTACPRCGCEHFVRAGFDKRYGEDGKVVESTQRYERRGCKRSFTRKTNSLPSLSKPPVETWTELVELERRSAPVEECRGRLGVSARTVHYMRMRPCDVTGAATPPVSCGYDDGRQVGGTYPDESTRGRGRRAAEMPREAHRTGDGVRGRGISNERVCVVVGVDDDGRHLAELCDRGRPTDRRVLGCLEGRVGPGSTRGTDDLGACHRVLPQLGVANHLVFPSDGSAGNGLFRASAAHARLRGFLRGLDGVSTRFLRYYCHWHDFLEFVRRGGRDLSAAMQDLVARGRYSTRRDKLYKSAPPFWEYWEGSMPQFDAAAV